MSSNKNIQDQKQQIRQNLIALENVKIESNKQKSSKYSLYMSQMSKFMRGYEDVYKPHGACQSCYNIYFHLFSKKKKSLSLKQLFQIQQNARIMFLHKLVKAFVLSTQIKLQILLSDIDMERWKQIQQYFVLNFKSYLFSQYVINLIYNQRILQKISIFIKDEQSPFHQNCQYSSGNFANVYKAKLQNKPIAVKCFKINEEKDIFSQFMKCLKEYAIFVTLSSFGAAPCYQTIKGFNITIYRNCIEFPMECCKEIITYNHQIEEDLRAALVMLHKNNIIHYDIKPENICFSPILNKFVFIDFGLSEIIPQNLGETKVLSFRGSLGYCSDQMKACSRLSFGQVDPYYNDLHCLNQSIKVLKQLNLQQHQEQNLRQMSSQFKFLNLAKDLLSLDLDKNYRNQIYTKIQALTSYQQCQQSIKSLSKFNKSDEVNKVFQKIMQKQLKLYEQKILQTYSINGPLIAQLYNSDNLIKEEQTINYYQQLFQPKQNQEQQLQQFHLYLLDIQSISFRKDDKIMLMRDSLIQDKINPIDLSNQQICREYYSQILKIIEKSTHQISFLPEFAHFLPSFLLFQIIQVDQIMFFFKLCLHRLEESFDKLQDTYKQPKLVFKFLMAIEWIQSMLLPTYHYDDIKELMYQQLHKSIQRAPIKQIDLQTSQIHWILLNLASQIKRSSTNHSYYLLANTIEKLGIYRQIDIQLTEIVQYLIYLIAKKMQFSFFNRKFFCRKFNSYLLENKSNENYKLYPYYFNTLDIFHLFSKNNQKWVLERIRISFQQFSFYKHNFLYYFDNLTIFDFPSLKMQITKIAENIQPQIQTAYLNRIVKMFLCKKYGSFISNQKGLNKFIYSLGNRQNILSYFLSRISQLSREQLHQSHELFIQSITALFRYLIGSIVSQIAINIEDYIIFSDKNRKNLGNPDQYDYQDFIRQQFEGRKFGRQKNLIQIDQFLKIWELLQAPSCAICKVRSTVYEELLRLLKLLFQGNQILSFELFTRLIIESHRYYQLKQFLNEALSIYFYFYSLRNVHLDHENQQFVNLVIQTAYLNPFQLNHIIINAYELFHQIFRQTLILNPLQAIYNLIHPTVLFNDNPLRNPEICEKFQLIFTYQWRRLKSEIPPQIFNDICRDHINIELQNMIYQAVQNKKDELFTLLGYVLAIMNVFLMCCQDYTRLYLFISLAIQHQRKNLKKFYIGKFYQVFRKRAWQLRFYKFKIRKIWMLKLRPSKFDQNPLIREIKMKMKKEGIQQKKKYKILYEKMLKYTKTNKN